MLGKKCFSKVHKVGDNFVICICPKAGKLKAVACFFASSTFTTALLLDMSISCGVTIILCMGAIGDYEYLYILK